MTFRLLVAILFTHHPLCKYYRKDVIKINNLLICKGCITTYPPFIIGIIIGVKVISIIGRNTTNLIISQPLIILLVWTSIVLTFFLIKDKSTIVKVKYILRIFLFLQTGILFDIFFINKQWIYINIAFQLCLISMVIILYKRILKIDNTCSKCIEFPYRNVGRCSGVRPITNYMELSEIKINTSQINDKNILFDKS